MVLTEEEFEALFRQCPTYEECLVAHIKEYQAFNDRICRLLDDIAEKQDKDGLNKLLDLFDLMFLEEAMQFRYYFCQGLIAGREHK